MLVNTLSLGINNIDAIKKLPPGGGEPSISKLLSQWQHLYTKASFLAKELITLNAIFTAC